MDEFARRLEEEKLAAVVELAYGASHEINNPLANIATRAQVLLRDELHPERRRMLTAIHAQAMRAHEMIADLMLFARPPRLAPEDVDLIGLVRDVADQWHAAAVDQSTELTVSAGEGCLMCRADATQLAVAVGALIRNALEALGSGGRVEIAVGRNTTSRNGDGQPPSLPLEIIVSDNGPGMSAELRRRAFDPFFSGREAGRGLGFGLSKCWRIIREHGGEVLLESEPGRGTRAAVRLRDAAPIESEAVSKPGLAPCG